MNWVMDTIVLSISPLCSLFILYYPLVHCTVYCSTISPLWTNGGMDSTVGQYNELMDSTNGQYNGLMVSTMDVLGFKDSSGTVKLASIANASPAGGGGAGGVG